MTAGTLRRLFVLYRRELQAYLTRKLRDPEWAADLTQETFLRYAEQGGGAAVVHDRSYLYRTAHNLAVDHLRRQVRQRTDSMACDTLQELPDRRPSLEDATDARLRLDRLRALIDELPARTRQIFVLNRIEGLSYAEVAAQLGISESSVQKHLAKALLHVTRRLGR
jgi:RNA polymerase sigma-70 factor (ECF subfamily)